MPPAMECVHWRDAVGHVALARIEGALLAIDGDKNDKVVKLVAVR